MKLSREEFVRLALQEIDAVDRVARSLSRDSADAADLVQETFLRALRAHESFDLQQFGIRPWLLRILHNTHLNRVKRERRAPLAMDAQALDTTAEPEAPPLIPSFEGSFQDEELNHALEQLPADLRTILILWAVDELSYKEMSHVLDVPIGTVMSRIYRARQRLFDLLPQHAAGRKT
jgi:RNA polymerase sigma-70 factor (ECF subfamily)